MNGVSPGRKLGGNQEAILGSILVKLNETLARLPCIHGFVASAAVDVNADGVVSAGIVLRCYECRQTGSPPPGALGALRRVLVDSRDGIEALGLHIGG